LLRDIPLASQIAFATSCGCVVVLALFRALVRRVDDGAVEAAHRVHCALLAVRGDGNGGRVEQVDGGASSRACVGCGVPHAVSLAVARRCVREAGCALHDALVADFQVAKVVAAALVWAGDGAAALEALSCCGLEDACRVTNAIGLRNVLGALVLARAVRNSAISIRGALDELRRVVTERAAASAAQQIWIPCAHDGAGVALGMRIQRLAALRAGAGRSVPHAVAVCVAIVHAVVLERAFHGAHAFKRVVAAHRVGFARRRVSFARAVGRARRVERVPDALRVVVAGRVACPAVRALLTAVSVDPHASRRDVAQGDGVEHVAVAVALS